MSLLVQVQIVSAVQSLGWGDGLSPSLAVRTA